MQEADFPALYVSADESSLDGQRRFVNASRLRLVALVFAAAGGAFSWQVESVDIFGLVALGAFVAAVGAEMFILRSRPDRLWYEGRAAAESVKTLTWRFMVGGEPFPVTLPPEDADRTFLERLHEVLQDLEDLALTPTLTTTEQITAEMRRVRTLGLDDRSAIYRSDRIEDQRQWYAGKSVWNATQGDKWALLALILEVVGVVGAAAKAFGVIDFDALGILAASAAGIAAWIQAKQYQTLNRAYFVASQELASINSQAAYQMSEPEWAQFVQESEEAISREHTLWRASRGVRVRHL